MPNTMGWGLPPLTPSWLLRVASLPTRTHPLSLPRSACFDFDFYKAHNPDLPAWGPATIWEHFVSSGQHEGRVFRCVLGVAGVVGLEGKVVGQVPLHISTASSA